MIIGDRYHGIQIVHILPNSSVVQRINVEMHPLPQEAFESIRGMGGIKNYPRREKGYSVQIEIESASDEWHWTNVGEIHSLKGIKVY